MNNGPRKGTQPETVATLKSIPSLRPRYQLHKNVREDNQNSTDDKFIANLEEKCSGRYIRMRVEPDGRSYTIEILLSKTVGPGIG
jgi:hypothetical protein